MKYVIVIDTDKKAVTAYPEKPYFLRTDSESEEELAFRTCGKAALRERYLSRLALGRYEGTF